MSSIGPILPQSVGTYSETPWSNNDWSSPENVYGAGEASVTAATFDAGDQTFVLKAYNFDFSAIPDGATIDGVVCVVNARYAVAPGLIDLVQLLDTSRARAGDNKAATPTALTTSAANYTYGALDNKWGNSLTPAWIKDPDFGVGIGMLAGGSGNNNVDVFCDSVTLTVYYTYTAPDELTAADITTGAPVVGASSIGQIHVLTSAAISTSAPTLEASTIGQVHVLTAAAITAGSPTLDAPTLEETGGEDNLEAADITTGVPVLEASAIGQEHVLSAGNIDSGAPALDAPNIGQVHVLAGGDVTSDIPTLGQPTIAQVHALTSADIVTGAPVFTAPTIAQIHILAANGIDTPAPILGAPTLAEGAGQDNLEALGIVTGTPTIDAPSLGQIHSLSAVEITTGSPGLDNPSIAQTHNLIAADIITGTPVFGEPSLAGYDILSANDILTGIPILGNPTLETITVAVLTGLGLRFIAKHPPRQTYIHPHRQSISIDADEDYKHGV